MSNMQDVDHTHPHTDETFGDAFRRGPDVVADGGVRDGTDESDEENTNGETMEDVDHESPTGAANRSFERGTEGRDESV